jgi:hypothetical protein
MATFSVVTLNGTLPPGRFDIQIEGIPPGEYLYQDEVSLDVLLNLIEVMAGPKESWPDNGE